MTESKSVVASGCIGDNMERARKKNDKRAQGFSESDGYVHCLYYSNGFIGDKVSKLII